MWCSGKGDGRGDGGCSQRSLAHSRDKCAASASTQRPSEQTLSAASSCFPKLSRRRTTGYWASSTASLRQPQTSSTVPSRTSSTARASKASVPPVRRGRSGLERASLGVAARLPPRAFPGGRWERRGPRCRRARRPTLPAGCFGARRHGGSGADSSHCHLQLLAEELSCMPAATRG